MNNKYDEILNLFISSKSSRERFKKPFIQDGLAHATDAFALVSIDKKLTSKYEEAKKEKYFNLGKIIKVLDPQEKITLPIKTIEKDIKKADLINEMSEGDRECEYCDGDGYRVCDLDHEHDCDECEASGRLPAPRPTGNKVPDPEQSFGFRMTYVSYCNLKKVLQVAEILGEDSVDIEVSSKEKQPVNFTVGKVLITIMPRSGADCDSINII